MTKSTRGRKPRGASVVGTNERWSDSTGSFNRDSMRCISTRSRFNTATMDRSSGANRGRRETCMKVSSVSHHRTELCDKDLGACALPASRFPSSQGSGGKSRDNLMRKLQTLATFCESGSVGPRSAEVIGEEQYCQ